MSLIRSFSPGSYKAIFLICFLMLSAIPFVSAQQECANMQQVISGIGKGDFMPLRGDAVAMGQEKEVYKAKTTITGGQAYIFYDERAQKIVFAELLDPEVENRIYKAEEGIPDTQEGRMEAVAKYFYKCLGNRDWILRKENGSQGPYFMLKNLFSRVFIKVSYEENVRVTLYLQKESIAYCASGNCQTGYGTYVLETGDIYIGDFYDSIPTGVGSYQFTESGIKYVGGWLNNQLNGFGILYNADDSENKRGYFINGQFHELDSSRTNICQAGDCRNGVGLVLFRTGEVYLGQFRNGIQQGFGMLESKNGVYYGQFANGLYNGYGVVYFANKTSFRGYFYNGRQQGEGIETYTDGQTVEGKYENGIFTGSEFNKFGVLVRQGKWQNAKFLPSSSTIDPELIKFAEKLNSFVYASISNDYSKLIDRAGKMTETLPGATDQGTLKSVNGLGIVMNMKPAPEKTTAALNSYYHQWVDRFRASLGHLWRAEEVKYQLGKNTLDAVYRFHHINKPGHYIELHFKDNNLQVQFI